NMMVTKTRAILIALVIIIIIVIVIVMVAKNCSTRRSVEETSKYIFNGKLDIVDIGHKVDRKGFRTYNPSITTLNETQSIIAERVSNFIGCNHESNKLGLKDIESFITLSILSEESQEMNQPKLVTLTQEQQNLLTNSESDSSSCPKGFEDPRPLLSPDGKELYLICNARTGTSCFSSMWLLKFALSEVKLQKKEISPKNILKLQTSFSESQTRHEKNWMPFVRSGSLYFVYSVNPHVILSCNLTNGQCEEVARTNNLSLSTSLRGGSQVLPLIVEGKEYLIGTIHERKSMVSYITRFYAFSATTPYQVLKISDEFVFDDHEEETLTSIQFAAGLNFTNNGENGFKVRVSYGEHDCHAKICTIDGVEFVKALKDIPMKSKDERS
ncbi:MAG: hypothetical protein ACMG6E_03260, partial [Candidatus Roizmanbacteria bacterium]